MLSNRFWFSPKSRIIDRTTPTEVVGSAYSTEGNSGRKSVRLNNGTLVSALIDSGVKYYKSTDNALTPWVLIASHGSANFNDVSIVTDGTYIFSLEVDQYSGPTFRKLDVSGTTINTILVDTGQNEINRGSMEIADNGDLHACWASKNATYSLGFNIRYSKSVDGGLTWDVPTQITSSNTTGRDETQPTIVIMSNGYPIIMNSYYQSGSYGRLKNYRFNGAVWTEGNVYDPASNYTQTNPSADLLSDGTIVVAWEGKDATDTAYNNIRFSQSTDNGTTWSAMEKLTNTVGSKTNDQPSITRDENDNVFIMYFDGYNDGVTNNVISLLSGVSGNWITEKNVFNSQARHPSTLSGFRVFEKPLTIVDTIYGDDNVKFYGKWTEL